MDANKQAVPRKPRLFRRVANSKPVTVWQLVTAFVVGTAAALAYFGLQSQFRIWLGLPGWLGVMVLGSLVCRDSRYLRQAIRGSAFMGGIAAGMGLTMSDLHHPTGTASDMRLVVASAAVFVALSLLGLLYDRTVVQGELRSSTEEL